MKLSYRVKASIRLKITSMLESVSLVALEELSIGAGIRQIQKVFNGLISNLSEYLELDPLYKNVTVRLISGKEAVKGESTFILDLGVERSEQDGSLIIEIDDLYERFLSFILLREAYYCFIDKEASELVKTCINQIVENDLSKVSSSKEWKELIKEWKDKVRNVLMNSEFMRLQYDKMEKFFSLEQEKPYLNVIQFFFKDIRDEALLTYDGNVEGFYDIIFERYANHVSTSLFDPDIVETIRILTKLFHEKKSYMNLTDYHSLFNEYKKKEWIETKLSLTKFKENLRWINKCTSIAPAYTFRYGVIGVHVLGGYLKFHPLLEKHKIKTVMEGWPFFNTILKVENSFATELYSNFIFPKAYLNNVINYFDKLKESGYVVGSELYHFNDRTTSLNLNYFKDASNVKKIIDPTNIRYKKEHEIKTTMEYCLESHPASLSLFDFILLERAKNVSVTGLTFDKRNETLNAIKDDVENELRKQESINKNFKDSMDKILNSPSLRQEFIQFIEEHEREGFLHLHFQLNYTLNCLSILKGILEAHSEFTNIQQLQLFLKTSAFSRNIEDHLLIRDPRINKIIFHDILPLYFQSNNSFEKELEKIKAFFNALNACNDLKILNLQEIERMVRDALVEGIYQERRKRYDDLFKSISLYTITDEKIESTIEEFLNHDPPLINPILINTILTSTFAKYYPDLIVKNDPEIQKNLEKLNSYFPRTYTYSLTDMTTNKKFSRMILYFMNFEEKGHFLSILYSLFKDSIVRIERTFWRGVSRASPLLRHHYDFEDKQFYYIKGLFEQLFTRAQEILGEKLSWSKKSMNNDVHEFLWPKNQRFNDLISTIKRRVSYQDISHDLKDLYELSEFRANLQVNLLDRVKFSDFKKRAFFKRHVSSIEFLPAFQKFGFSQYYLYIRPIAYNEVNFRLLFINTFQDVKYPACIVPEIPMLIKFIFPFRTPNISYLNWLVKSDLNASEYCLFHVKKFHDIIHFDRNLTREGWYYSSVVFKSYMQNILFNSTHELKISGMREFEVSEGGGSAILSPDSEEYEALTQVYDTQSIDIKTFLGTSKHSVIDNILSLLEKGLIFPYISLKNLDFQDKISIILPNVKKEFNEKLIKIFSFFNVCRIHEIEGDFYLYGFEDVRPFENGLLIEVWFPKCEMDEFIEIFELLFQYLEIDHYLMLNDLVDGDNLIKSVFGNLNFLKSYNPLKNLTWNEKDKIWMNPKIIKEKFEPIYPVIKGTKPPEYCPCGGSISLVGRRCFKCKKKFRN